MFLIKKISEHLKQLDCGICHGEKADHVPVNDKLIDSWHLNGSKGIQRGKEESIQCFVGGKSI